ncbi:MAG: PQQ-dependent sugar dehydrogenase [Cytophagaceae bacterium]|nr:PQQ-dependent sugar dehydrogenase [Cytophagaceae bacterium]
MKTILSFVVMIVLSFAKCGYAQTLPTGFSRVLISSGLSSPTAFAFTPDGSDIFVTQQGGKLRLIQNGVMVTDPVVTLTVNNTGERGLIGVAVHPDFATNHYVYLYHTVPAGVERTAAFNKIVRLTMNGATMAAGSLVTILELNDLSSQHTNHNGGAIAFGPDGKLYVAVGENATGANAQDLDNYLGKILRVNPDGSVPKGNPFTGNDAKSRIWAYGLRNPYSITFDRISGRLFVNDVGEGTWEEINDATTGGLNFGWPNKEGFCTTNCTNYTQPIHVYGHASNTDGQGCSIVGGTFFNPVSTTYPVSYRHQYFFNDYCGKWINDISVSNPDEQYSFGTDMGGGLTYLVTSLDGELYYLSRGDQSLYKISYSTSFAPPSISDQPDDATVSTGDPASFNVVAYGSGALTYQWYKNGEVITGANQLSYSISQAGSSDQGTYSVLVSSIYGSILSDVGMLIVNNATAVTDPIKNNVFNVFPNPSSGKVNIALNTNTNDFIEVSIRNGQGEELSKQQIPVAGAEVDLSSYPNGLYFLQVQGYGAIVIKQ